jgi:hypothetical protein
MSDIPRRVRLDVLLPAEGDIDHAQRIIESLPADVRLDDAMALLRAARDSVSDYINNSVPVRRQVWSGLMAGFIPAETDRITSNSGDQGGPSAP